MDFNIYTKRIGRYLKEEFIRGYRSRACIICISKRFFCRIKKRV